VWWAGVRACKGQRAQSLRVFHRLGAVEIKPK